MHYLLSPETIICPSRSEQPVSEWLPTLSSSSLKCYSSCTAKKHIHIDTNTQIDSLRKLLYMVEYFKCARAFTNIRKHLRSWKVMLDWFSAVYMYKCKPTNTHLYIYTSGHRFFKYITVNISKHIPSLVLVTFGNFKWKLQGQEKELSI